MVRDILKWLLLALGAVVVLLIFQKKNDAPDPSLEDSTAIVRQTAGEKRQADSISNPYYNDVQFAFADSTGRFLVCDGVDSLAHAPYILVTSDGSTIPLRFAEYRKEGKQSTGRQTMNNFDNTGGSIFFSESQKLVPDQTYLIVSSDFLKQHRPLHLIENENSDIDTSIIERITRSKARSIQKTWPIASLDTIGSIVVVWFKNDGPHPLASLVLVKSDILVFEDYVGDESREGSVWRVDDGGEFSGDAINVIAAFQSSAGIELARTWGGVEGENAELLQQSKDRFVSVADNYRYWVPE